MLVPWPSSTAISLTARRWPWTWLLLMIVRRKVVDGDGMFGKLSWFLACWRGVKHGGGCSLLIEFDEVAADFERLLFGEDDGGWKNDEGKPRSRSGLDERWVTYLFGLLTTEKSSLRADWLGSSTRIYDERLLFVIDRTVKSTVTTTGRLNTEMTRRKWNVEKFLSPCEHIGRKWEVRKAKETHRHQSVISLRICPLVKNTFCSLILFFFKWMIAALSWSHIQTHTYTLFSFTADRLVENKGPIVRAKEERGSLLRDMGAQNFGWNGNALNWYVINLGKRTMIHRKSMDLVERTGRFVHWVVENHRFWPLTRGDRAAHREWDYLQYLI